MSAEPPVHPTPPKARPVLWAWAFLWPWVRRMALLLLALWLLAWAAFYLYFAPRAERWQPQVEDWASAQLGLPVRMDGLSLSRGWAPTLAMQGVRVSDARGDTVLRLPVVKASFSPLSLWRLNLTALRIEQPNVQVRRSAEGRIFISGMALDEWGDSADGSSAVADWFFALPRFELEGGQVLWQDDLRSSPPLALSEVSVRLRNGLGRHRLQLAATPPPDWGQRLSLQADMRGATWRRHVGDWRQWHGQVALDLPQLKAAPLGQYLGGQVHLAEATGGFQAQAQWQHGQWQRVQVQSHISAAKLRLQHDLPYLSLRNVQGDWTWLAQGPKDKDGHAWPMLKVEGLQFATEGGLQWPASQMQLRLKPGPKAGDWADWEGGLFAGDVLDLGVLTALAQPLPMAAPFRQHLRSLQAQGQLRDWSFAWRGELTEPSHYSASGQVQGLALQPASVDAQQPHAPQRPGLAGANVDFALTEAGGSAQLHMQQGWLAFPGVFEPERVAIDALQAQLQWTQNEGGELALQVPQLRFANADAQGQAKAEWRSVAGQQGAARFPGWLRLEGELERGEGTAVWRYLPLQIGDEARDYVRHAIQAGVGRQGRFHIEGDMRHIPSADPKQSRFYIAAQIEGARYDFAPAALLPKGSKPWPVLEDLQGELVFDGMGMAVRGAKGRSGALQVLQAQGQLRDWSFAWRGDLTEPSHYSASGQVQGLALQPASVDAQQPHAPQRPGLAGANVDFALTEAGGSAQLHMQQGWLAFPGVFEPERVAIDALQAQLQWTQNEGGELALQVPQLRFANADAQGQAKAEWRSVAGQQGAARFPGWLRLEGELERGEGTAVWRYLPLQIGDEARDYVRHAIQAGVGRQGRFHIEGDMRHIPSADPKQSRFYIAAQIEGARYDFAPAALLPKGSKPWPVLEDLQGELVFDGMGMAVRGAKGRSGALQVLQAQAHIADWHDLQVQTEGQLQGDLGAALGVLRHSAIGDLLSGALQQAEGEGSSRIDLKLHLPIEALTQSKVQGEVALQGNRLRLHPHMPWLSQAQGRVGFSEQGFVLRQTQAQGLGGQVRAEGGMGPLAGFAADDEGVHIQVQGQLQAEALRRQQQLPWLAQLGQKAEGSTPYALNLDFVGDFIDFDMQSDLQGLALNLPQPLRKNADEAWPTQVQQKHSGTGLAVQHSLQADVGQALRLHYRWAEAQGQPQAVRGRLALGQAARKPLAALPAQGVQWQVQLAQLPLEDWLALRPAAAAPSIKPKATPEKPPAQAAENPPWQAFLPTAAQVRVGALRVGERSLNQLQAQIKQQAGQWQLQGQAKEASGSLHYAPPDAQHGAGKISARLTHLDWTEEKRQAIHSSQRLPALDVAIAQFSYHGQPLGQVAIEAENLPAAGEKMGAWRLHKLHIDTPESHFKGEGSWQPNAEQGRTELQFDWHIDDAGRLLERLGQKGVLAQGQGQLKGHIAWPGPVSHPQPASMTGELRLDVKKGRLLQAEPGAAKLLGVLNLQALPRRLGLDFRDVFAQGFAFDFVRGDVQIQDGLAQTNNLQMKGVNAAVLLEGVADLNDETQDVRVLIVPEINAGTAALIATAINPAVGLGSFVAQWLLSKPVNKVATQELRITGSWREPKVEKIKTAKPAPEPQTLPDPAKIQP